MFPLHVFAWKTMRTLLLLLRSPSGAPPSGAPHTRCYVQVGLALFYRPAIRAVQTAQEVQIVPGAVLGLPLEFTEQLRPRRQRLAQSPVALTGADPWPARFCQMG